MASSEQDGMYPGCPNTGQGVGMLCIISILPMHSFGAVPFGPYVGGAVGSRAVAGSGVAQAHLALRRQKGSSGAGTRMVLKMGR